MSASVELRGVRKGFGAVDAVAPIDLEVEAGEFVTLLGPSGCGKTTLLRLMAGLIEPDDGEITIDGHRADRARVSKRVAFVPQSPALLPWRSVRANAELLTDLNSRVPAVESRPDVGQLLDEVGLGGFADARPHELSGGMQQRVALVRAFALGSPVLLMDEPFAALDEMTRADMRHLLVRLRGVSGATVVFVTHSVAEAVFLSDRVAMLSPRPGRVVAEREIDLPRPRHADVEDTPAFFDHVTALRSILRDGHGEADAS